MPWKRAPGHLPVAKLAATRGPHCCELALCPSSGILLRAMACPWNLSWRAALSFAPRLHMAGSVVVPLWYWSLWYDIHTNLTGKIFPSPYCRGACRTIQVYRHCLSFRIHADLKGQKGLGGYSISLYSLKNQTEKLYGSKGPRARDGIGEQGVSALWCCSFQMPAVWDPYWPSFQLQVLCASSNLAPVVLH